MHVKLKSNEKLITKVFSKIYIKLTQQNIAKMYGNSNFRTVNLASRDETHFAEIFVLVILTKLYRHFSSVNVDARYESKTIIKNPI